MHNNNIIDSLKQFHEKYKNNLTKSFNEYLQEIENDFRYSIKREAFTNVLLEALRKKYPEYIFINEGVPDDHLSIGIGIFNIPDELYNYQYKSNFRSIEDDCYDLVDDINKDQMDVMFMCRTVSTTKEHYQHIIDRHNLEKGYENG